MTIDKAIDCNLSLLEFMKIENMLHPDCTFNDANFEALEMAIEALKALSDCLEKPNNSENDDCISRKWCLAEYDRQHVGPPGGARKIIAEAPSIFPTKMSGTSDFD